MTLRRKRMVVSGWTKKSSPEVGFKVMNVETEKATRCRSLDSREVRKEKKT